MMAAENELTPTEYISHHLTNMTASVGQGDFWVVHVDTLVMSVLLGVLSLGFLWWIVRGVTAGIPGKRQAFVELAVEFVDEQVKGIFHGDRHKFISPAALTVFVWVLLMNAMDFLPVDIMAWSMKTCCTFTTGAACPPPTSIRPSRSPCPSGC